MTKNWNIAMFKMRYSLIEKVSLFYVFIPTVLFCAGWLKLYLSIPVILIILLGLYLSTRKENIIKLEDEEVFTSSLIVLLLVLAAVFILVYFSGTGGYVLQDGEYDKHNAFLKDLIECDWPIIYKELGPEKRTYALATYVGYYLPSAFVGKLFGWKIANHFTFLWAYLGMLLTVIWFCRLIGKVSIFYVLMFFFFGGLDIVGQTLLDKWPGAVITDVAMENWMLKRGETSLDRLFWVYPANIFILYGGPHHVLPSWLIALMVLYNGFVRKTSNNIFFLSSACLVGSVFFSIGLFPFVLIATCYTKAKKLFTFPNMVAGPIIVMVIGLFVISNNGDFPHGFIWKFHNMWNYWPTLALFYIIEFGIYALVCPKVDKNGTTIPFRLLWWSSITGLLLFPWYLIGAWSDFTSKSSRPAALVFLVCLALAIIHAKTDKQKGRVYALKILLCIGACSGLFKISRVLDHDMHLHGVSVKSVKTTREIIEKRWEISPQLLASPDDSIFWKYLAKKPGEK